MKIQSTTTQADNRGTMNETKTAFGIRSTAIIEILAIIFLTWLADFFSGAPHTLFFDVSPHPLWIAVLLVTVQYGTAEGVLAAVACTAALLILGGIPERTISMKGYEYTLYILKNPLLWLIAAVFLGELRMRHVRERQALLNQNRDIQVQANTIADNYERVRGAKERLEARVAGQFRSSLQAYQAAKQIEKLHPSDVLQGVEEIITSVLAPEKFSVWLLSKEGMETTITYGWKEGEAYDTFIPADFELYRQIVGKQQVMHVANADYERALQGQAVIAGPLFSTETGEIVGMLKVEKLGFSDLSLTTVETFRSICDWVAMAFINARRYQEAKADTVFNAEHNMMTYGYFQRYTDYITALAKRLRFDVNMIVVKLAHADRLPAEERADVAKSLGTAVNDVLRSVDLAFDYHKTGEEYSIVLPATNRPGADVVLDKLKSAVAKRLPDNMRNVDFVYSVHTVHQVA